MSKWIELQYTLSTPPTPFQKAVVIATPWMNINGNIVSLTLPKVCSCVVAKIQRKVENLAQEALNTKSLEYLQSMVLSVILERIIWDHTLKLASWKNDTSHKIDAILTHWVMHYNIDFTLDVYRFWNKIDDNKRGNASDWVVLLGAPENNEFHKFVLGWYSGDYTEESLKNFLKEHLDRLQSIQWNIKDRHTKEVPTLIQNKLSI